MAKLVGVRSFGPKEVAFHQKATEVRSMVAQIAGGSVGPTEVQINANLTEMCEDYVREVEDGDLVAKDIEVIWDFTRRLMEHVKTNLGHKDILGVFEEDSLYTEYETLRKQMLEEYQAEVVEDEGDWHD